MSTWILTLWKDDIHYRQKHMHSSQGRKRKEGDLPLRMFYRYAHAAAALHVSLGWVVYRSFRYGNVSKPLVPYLYSIDRSIGCCSGPITRPFLRISFEARISLRSCTREGFRSGRCFRTLPWILSLTPAISAWLLSPQLLDMLVLWHRREEPNEASSLPAP